ncbi:MAG TPA: type IV secretion system DNA-binding domain-containing protein [Candidatus Paceibacterota bacterium]|nr:type IV secretion system DNA-binding domain-containing protein [Candidatus Paceibacterota bacterium]HRY76890.1 type IV secretion system DNA-binding domain-containing protein [Candidatus Paceibacterota bacterium]
MQKDVTIFAETNFRNQRVKFGIKTDDRRKHMYAIGKTGMGKTVMLENMAIDDIRAGRGLAFIDPHGESAQRLLSFVPKERLNDVIYFCPPDLNFPIAFNPLEAISEEHHHLVASSILEIFKKIWPDVWSARMEYILNNCLMALLEYSDSTLLDIMRLLTDNDFRKKIVDSLKDPVVKNFWVNEYARYNERFQTEAIAPIQNKVGQFLTNPLIRNIIGQKKSSFDIRKAMDEGKILIVNISKGLMGESNSALLGAMMVTKIEQAAMSRADVPESERPDFFLYVDEFQTFATESFANILSEARKYHLSLIISHQYIAQLPEPVKFAIFGNVGTFVVFRVGAEDAEWLEKEFEPEFMANDLVNLAKYNIYLKLMIDGMTSKAFSASTLAPYPIPEEDSAPTIIEYTRTKYAVPRLQIETEITQEWSKIDNHEEAGGRRDQGGRGEGRERSKPVKKPFSDFCWVCGQETDVAFQPDGRRPIYCKNCYDGVKAGEIIPPTKPKKLETLIVKSASVKNLSSREKEEKPEFPKRPGVNLDELRKSLQESLGKLQKKEEDKKEETSSDSQ